MTTPTITKDEAIELDRLRKQDAAIREWLSNPPHPGKEWVDGYIHAMAYVGQVLGDPDWSTEEPMVRQVASTDGSDGDT